MENWELEIRPELPEGCPASGLEIETILFLDSQRKAPAFLGCGVLGFIGFRAFWGFWLELKV